PQPGRPAHGILRIDADASLAHLVASNVGEEGTLIGVSQRQVDGIVAGLDAERGLDRDVSNSPLNGSRDACPRDNAPVMLVELVALKWIIEEVGEVVEQVERALDDVCVRLPVTRIVTLGHTARDGEPARDAPVAWIFSAEAGNLTYRYGALGHLVG